MLITYISDNDILLKLLNYIIRQLTDIPPTVNGQHIGRVSADMSTDIIISVVILAEYRLMCQPIYWSKGAQNTHDPKLIYST